MKKVLILFFALFLSFSFVSLAQPNSRAFVQGPKFRHPTKAELENIKCTKDPEFINTEECKKFNKKDEDKKGF